MTIRRVKGGFKVVSKKGKALSRTLTKAGAKKRLREVEFFKRNKQ